MGLSGMVLDRERAMLRTAQKSGGGLWPSLPAGRGTDDRTTLPGPLCQAHGAPKPAVQSGPPLTSEVGVESAEQAVLDHGAAILGHDKAGALRAFEAFVVVDADLQPHALGTDRDSVVDDRAGLFGTDEDIDQVDRDGDITEGFVGRFAEDFGCWEAAAMDGDDAVAVLLQVPGDVIGGAVGAGIEADNGDGVGFAEEFERRISRHADSVMHAMWPGWVQVTQLALGLSADLRACALSFEEAWP